MTNSLVNTWSRAKLYDLASLKGGFAFKSKEYTEDGIPILRMGNVTRDFKINWNKKKQPFLSIDRIDEFEGYLLTGGELIICLTDMSSTGDYLGTVAINNRKALLNQRVSKFEFDENNINKKYLYYALCEPRCRHYMVSDDTGSLQKNTNHTHVLNYDICFPPDIEEQKLIVSEIEKQFSRLDEAVAALKRIKANLKRYKASVLKAAVEGKLTEEWRKEHPDVEPASELLKRILVERRRKWEEAFSKKKYKEPAVPDISYLPELPEGWIWVSLEMSADALGGYAFKSKEFVDSGHQIVKMANIKMEKLDLTQKPSFILDVPDEIIEKYRLIDGDILITLTGTRKKRDYGYVVQIKETKTSLLLNQRIARLRPYLHELSVYLSMVLQSEVYRNRFFSYETGNVGQGNVGVKAVTIESIPLPPLEEQIMIMREYARNVSVANNIEHDVDNNLKRAERLRQSILKKAFSGRLVSQEMEKTAGVG